MIFDNFHKLYKEIYENLNSFQNLQKKVQKNPKLRHFKVKNVVYIYIKGKFHKKCSGPFEVIERVNSVIGFLNDIYSPLMQVHVNKLKLVPPRNRNRWVSSFAQQNNQDNMPIQLIQETPT